MGEGERCGGDKNISVEIIVKMKIFLEVLYQAQIYQFSVLYIYHTKSDNFIQVTWRYEMSMTQTYILNDT